MLRLFAAIPIPDEIAQGLGWLQSGPFEARWSPPENLHLTLRFFGEVSEAVAADLDLELGQITSSSFTLALALAGVGGVGEGAELHVIWAGVQADAQLDQLARACERAARRAGLRAETRAFRPHITLAYLPRTAAAQVAPWLQAHNLYRSAPFSVNTFGLYSSHRTRQGSRYSLERLYRL